MVLNAKFLSGLEKSKKMIRSLPVLVFGGLLGAAFIAILAVFLRKKTKRRANRHGQTNDAE